MTKMMRLKIPDVSNVQASTSNEADSHTTRTNNDKQPQITSLTAQAKEDNSSEPKLNLINLK